MPLQLGSKKFLTNASTGAILVFVLAIVLAHNRKESKMTRNLQQLVELYNNLTNDQELVAFIDSLNAKEVKIMDRAMLTGVVPTEPAYILRERV